MEPGAEQWEKVKSLFDAALQRSSAEREQFLVENCPDESIRTEVLSLLHNLDSAGSFMPSSPEPDSAAVVSQPVKALSLNTRLGPYQITAFIGAGGMGEVYRARDTRLGRSVAIKVLPEAVANNRDRLRRFEQEARAVATLSHPNILALFDIGSQDGISYVVYEFLEGATLRQQLASGPIPRRKAVEFAVQITRGLSAAHAKGFVHRDLKPENIFITRDARVKILDFGLAKSLSRQGSLTTVSAETGPGVVLGTAGYMSPEQVRGESVNHLSDIFSFGAVLFEMLTGRRAFEGNTNLETMSAILKEDVPDLATLNPSLPQALSRIVRHCLEKNPDERFHSARDVAFDLESLLDVSLVTTSATFNKRRSQILAVTGLLLGVVGIGIAVRLLSRFGSGMESLSFHQLTFRRGLISNARFTSDGTTVLYSAWWDGSESRTFMTREDSPESLPLDPPGATLQSVGPPGEMLINFRRGNDALLARVPLTGGNPRPIADGIFWADVSPADNQIATVRNSGGLNRIEYPPGKVIYSTAAAIVNPRFAPDGKSLAIIEWAVRDDDAGWLTILDTSGKKKTASEQFATIRGTAWNPSSKEVLFTAAETNGLRSLRAIDLSGKQRLLYRAPSPLIVKDVSSTGRVLLTREDERWGITGKGPSNSAERDLSWFDYSLAIDVSPDGRALLIENGGGEEETYVIYLRPLDGSSAVRLGLGSAQAFSPDGKWVLACSTKTPRQLFLLPVGPGEKRGLTNDSLNHTAAAWFPDGQKVLFEANEPGRPLRLYLQRLDGSPPVPATPEGTSFVGHQSGQHMISFDEKSIFALAPDGLATIYKLDGSPPHRPKGFAGDDRLIRWTASKDVIYIRKLMDFGDRFPSEIYRLNVNTGERSLWAKIPAPDLAGFNLYNLLLTPDGRSYFYSYSRELSTLFLADGLK